MFALLPFFYYNIIRLNNMFFVGIERGNTMRCEVCKGSSHQAKGICMHCGSLSQSPVQGLKESVHNHLINILLGSFGFIILGIILFSAATEM